MESKGIENFAKVNSREEYVWFKPYTLFRYFFNNIKINENKGITNTKVVDFKSLGPIDTTSKYINITIVDRTLSGFVTGAKKKLGNNQVAKLKNNLGLHESFKGLVDSTFLFQDVLSLYLNIENKPNHQSCFENITLLFNGVNNGYVIYDTCIDEKSYPDRNISNYKNIIIKSDSSISKSVKEGYSGRTNFKHFLSNAISAYQLYTKAKSSKVVVNIISDFDHEENDDKYTDSLITIAMVEKSIRSFIDSLHGSLEQLNLYQLSLKKNAKNPTAATLIKGFLNFSQLHNVKWYDVDNLLDPDNPILTPGVLKPTEIKKNSITLIEFNRPESKSMFVGSINIKYPKSVIDTLSFLLRDKKNEKNIPLNKYLFKYYVNNNNDPKTIPINDWATFISKDTLLQLKIDLNQSDYSGNQNDYELVIFTKAGKNNKYVFPISFYESTPINNNYFFLILLLFVFLAFVMALFSIPHNRIWKKLIININEITIPRKIVKQDTLLSYVAVALSPLSIVAYFSVYCFLFYNLLVLNNIKNYSYFLIGIVIFLMIYCSVKRKAFSSYLSDKCNITSKTKISRYKLLSLLLYKS